jgi:hypothetical protein
MIAAGAQPLEVSRRLGHASPMFSMSAYGHPFPGADEKLNQSLDGLPSATDRA